MEKLNQWLSLLANLGVVAGLVFLGIELRQNSEATQFAAAHANRAERIDRFTAFRDSPYMPGIVIKYERGEALTAEEERRLGAHTAVDWALLYSEWVQREMGTAGKFATKGDPTVKAAMSNPRMVEFWDRRGALLFPNAFVEYIESFRQ